MALQEYVIRLGTQIDNDGVSKIMALLDSNKLKALGLTAALGAATTAVYKFIESATKEEFELEQLAKKQSKTIENTRAEQAALKSMGMTLQEINKSRDLKEIYNDLVKVNKQMALPDIKDVLRNVNKLRGAFWELKSTLSYLVQWTNAKVLGNLAEPLERITGKVKDFSTWIRENMNSIAMKIGSYITGFAKGIIGIVEGVGKIFDWVNQLPDAIKGIAVAIGAVYALIKSGPIGQILAMIELIGGLIDDYENFKANMAEGLNPGDKGYTDIALPGLWSILEGEGTTKEKVDKIFGDLGEAVSENIVALTETLNGLLQGVDMGTIFGGSEGNPGLIDRAKEWLDKNEDKLKTFGASLIDFVSRAFATGGGFAGGALGKIFDTIFGDGTIDSSLYEGDGSAGATFATGIGAFVSGFVKRLGEKDSNIIDALKQGLGDMTIGTLLGSVISNIKDGDIQWGEVGTDLEAVGKSFLGIISESIKSVKDLGSYVLGLVGKGLTGMEFPVDSITDFTKTLGATFEKWSQNDTLITGMSTAIGALFAGGNVMESIATGLVTSIVTAREDAMRKALKSAEQMPEDIIDNLSGADLENAFGKLDDKYKQSLWGDVFSDLGGAGADLVSGLWDSLLAGARGAIGLSSELMDKLFQTITDLLLPGSGTEVKFENNKIVGGLGISIGTALAGGNFITSIFTGLTSTIASLLGDVGEGKKYASLWDAIKGEAQGFWDSVLDLWYGPIEGKYNGSQLEFKRNGNKGLVSVFGSIIEEIKSVWSEVWSGEDGEGGLRSVFDGLAKNITSWLSPVGEAVKAWFNDLMSNIYENASPFVKWLFEQSGLVSTRAEFGTDENGKTVIKSGAGTYTGETAQEYSPEAQSLLDWLLPFLKVNNKGELEGNGELDVTRALNIGQAGEHLSLLDIVKQVLSTGQMITDGKTPFSLEAIAKEYRGLNYSVDSPFFGSLLYAPGEVGTPDAYKEYLKSRNQAKVETKVDNKIQETINAGGPYYADVVLEADDEGSGGGGSGGGGAGGKGSGGGRKELLNAYGGRYSQKTKNITVAEDGDTEYVIPISKGDRTIGLIKQMLSEIAPSMLNRISADLGLGTAGTIGASLESASSALQGMGMNITNIVNATTNIYVTASGASAEEVGRSAYNAAERHLVKTLQGVYA